MGQPESRPGGRSHKAVAAGAMGHGIAAGRPLPQLGQPESRPGGRSHTASGKPYSRMRAAARARAFTSSRG